MAESIEIGIEELAELDMTPFEQFNAAMGADGDASPYPGFAAARQATPVRDEMAGVADTGGLSLFSVFSFEAVQRVLGDSANVSSSGYAEVMGPVFGHSILEMDGDEHHRYRSMIQNAFTRGEIARWGEELIAPLINRLIDGFVEDGRAELVGKLFFPFPLMVIAEMMGLPAADFPKFHRLAIELIGVTVDMDRALAASASLADYLTPIIRDRRGGSGRDLITGLANAEFEGSTLDDDEILAFLRLLLPAGAETTYRSSSNMLFGLLTNPDQLAALRDDRSLMASAIEEAVRWEPPLLLIARNARNDVEVCGTTIPAGASIICYLGAANHDETRWEDPESFDMFRRRKTHMGFAHGTHVCLGMHLAKLEMATVIGALLDRLPNLRLDPDAPAPYISGMTFRAPPRLDVVWG